MTRKELLRLMPRNSGDLEAAKRIVALGWPDIEPILSDIAHCLRFTESPVADTFADFLATIGEPAVQTVAFELQRPNIYGRHRILTSIIPRWSDVDISQMLYVLTTIATDPDAWDNDLRAIEVLAKRKMVEPQWLRAWWNFKSVRMNERSRLLSEVDATLNAE